MKITGLSNARLTNAWPLGCIMRENVHPPAWEYLGFFEKKLTNAPQWGQTSCSSAHGTW